MKGHTTGFILVTFISASLILGSKAFVASKQSQATAFNTMSDSVWTCHDGFMSLYISKSHFADLPFAIYVQDEHGRYFQATAIAKQCHYFLEETDTFIILMVAYHGCFVRREKHFTNMTVVIMAVRDRGRVKIVKSILPTCERKIKALNITDYPPVSGHSFCDKDGFNITIPYNATTPPLNLDAVRIPSNRSHNCKPQERFKDAVTFSFSFTDCGTQSVEADGFITYWVNIEVRHLERGLILRDPPFRLIVHCSFALAHMTHLGIKVQEENPPPILKSEGILRAAMRFAKDSKYRSFYSSRDPPVVTELGQSVYVEVFVLKHEDKDLMLLLNDCWATPSENPHHSQRWNLLVNGCPFSGDSHRTVIPPVVSSKELKYPSLHKWFVVKMFSFVKPPTIKNLIYFHCDIEICKGSSCSKSCSSGRRQLRRNLPKFGQRTLYSVVSSGPLHYFL